MKAQVIYDSQGNAITLGRELGKGGEGSVIEVARDKNLAAKIYHHPVDPHKAEKLLIMSKLKADSLLNISAWPTDVLYNSDKRVVGFLMPKIEGYKAIFLLYGPKSRLQEFERVNWPFLIHASINVARAFAEISKNGIVIGDVNHGNLLISNQGTVKLIDCDSFQISDNGRYFLCEVGVSTHTPSELQGKSFKEILRTPNHDAFGLATLIFQLLFMGRHPFAGHYLGQGDMPIDKAITEFRFAYGSEAASRQMKQPPGIPSLQAVSEPVAALFESAFSPSGVTNGRPSPLDWISSLQRLQRSLVQCKTNHSHHYYKNLSICPWCEIESRSGVLLFHITLETTSATETFDLQAIWNQIQKISRPAPVPFLPVKSSINVSPSQDALAIRKTRLLQKITAGAIFILILLALTYFSLFNFWSVIITFLIIFNIAFSDKKGDLNMGKLKLTETQNRWKALERRWLIECGNGEYDKKMTDLNNLRDQYLNLDNLMKLKIKELNDNREKAQLHNFLDQRSIDQANISGIGSGRKATLQSYGVETAADVTQSAILAVPGFGPTFTQKLINWRRSIESQFVFNPSQVIDPKEIAAIEREIESQRAKIESGLKQGPQQLQQIIRQLEIKRENLKQQAAIELRALIQAEVDLKTML